MMDGAYLNSLCMVVRYKDHELLRIKNAVKRQRCSRFLSLSMNKNSCGLERNKIYILTLNLDLFFLKKTFLMYFKNLKPPTFFFVMKYPCFFSNVRAFP